MKIYVEGVKYSGKSTLVKLLGEWFPTALNVDELEDVEDIGMSEMFSNMLVTNTNPISKLLIESGIRYKLHKDLLDKRNGIIIVDRSFLSSLVYNIDLTDIDAREVFSIYDMTYHNNELLDMFTKIHSNYTFTKTLLNRDDIMIFIEEDFGYNYEAKVYSRNDSIKEEHVKYIKDTEEKRYLVYDSYLKNANTFNGNTLFNAYGINVVLGGCLLIRLSPAFMRLPKRSDCKQEVILSNIIKNYALGTDRLVDYINSLKKDIDY